MSAPLRCAPAVSLSLLAATVLTPDAPYSGTPVPMRFENRFLACNDLVEIRVRPDPTNP